MIPGKFSEWLLVAVRTCLKNTFCTIIDYKENGCVTRETFSVAQPFSKFYTIFFGIRSLIVFYVILRFGITILKSMPLPQ